MYKSHLPVLCRRNDDQETRSQKYTTFKRFSSELIDGNCCSIMCLMTYLLGRRHVEINLYRILWLYETCDTRKETNLAIIFG